MLAILAAVEAVNSRAEERPSARLDASAAPANHLSLSQPGPGRPATPFSVPAPFPEPGQHQPVQPVVPVGRQSIHVPILMYHYIRVNPNPADRLGFDLSVTPEDFNSQMDWLAGHGYHPIDFNDLRAYFAGQRPLPERPVIVTLDDGYRDLYTTAYPILRAHGFKAVAYIVSGFLGAPNNVDRDQVRDMDAGGIEIAAHTVSHVDLTRVNDIELWHQLADCRAELEHLLGHPVVDFAYPAGRFNARAVAAVAAAGYLTATTTEPGTLHSMADRFTWPRVRVRGGEPLDRFISDLGPTEPTVMEAVPGVSRPSPPRPMLPRPPLSYPFDKPPRPPRALASPLLKP